MMNTDTSAHENGHKFLAKVPYSRTSRQKGFEKQMIRWTRRWRMMLGNSSWYSYIEKSIEDDKVEQKDKQDIRTSKEFTITWNEDKESISISGCSLPMGFPKNILQILLRSIYKDLEWPLFDNMKDKLCFKNMISSESIGCLRAESNYKDGKSRFDTVKINWADGDGIWYARIYGFIGLQRRFQGMYTDVEDLAVIKSFDYYNSNHIHEGLKTIALKYIFDPQSEDLCKWDIVNISAISKKVLILQDFDNEKRFFVVPIHL